MCAMRDEHEFFPVEQVPWEADGGIEQRVLSRGEDGVTLTRQTRWPAGHDTTGGGVIRHQFHEEVFLLDGDLTDLTLGRTFGPGDYASRRPGMPHGPYRTESGCLMLEIRTTDAW
jgi:hypothetical protein